MRSKDHPVNAYLGHARRQVLQTYTADGNWQWDQSSDGHLLGELRPGQRTR
jgi:hypothetical protein